jgi:hypothetical protein
MFKWRGHLSEADAEALRAFVNDQAKTMVAAEQKHATP